MKSFALLVVKQPHVRMGVWRFFLEHISAENAPESHIQSHEVANS